MTNQEIAIMTIVGMVGFALGFIPASMAATEGWLPIRKDALVRRIVTYVIANDGAPLDSILREFSRFGRHRVTKIVIELKACETLVKSTERFSERYHVKGDHELEALP